jgi:hypothetical protein
MDLETVWASTYVSTDICLVVSDPLTHLAWHRLALKLFSIHVCGISVFIVGDGLTYFSGDNYNITAVLDKFELCIAVL